MTPNRGSNSHKEAEFRTGRPYRREHRELRDRKPGDILPQRAESLTLSPLRRGKPVRQQDGGKKMKRTFFCLHLLALSEASFSAASWASLRLSGLCSALRNSSATDSRSCNAYPVPIHPSQRKYSAQNFAAKRQNRVSDDPYNIGAACVAAVGPGRNSPARPAASEM
jgi:hypothetical protein